LNGSDQKRTELESVEGLFLGLRVFVSVLLLPLSSKKKGRGKDGTHLNKLAELGTIETFTEGLNGSVVIADVRPIETQRIGHIEEGVCNKQFAGRSAVCLLELLHKHHVQIADDLDGAENRFDLLLCQ